MADIEFFFDPVCPWAWITSRWVEEVRRQRAMSVDWKFIALRIVNEKRDYERDFPARYDDFHTMGWRLLRVAAAVREAEGPEAVGPYYEGVSGGIHVDRRRDEFLEAEAVVGVLKGLGYDPALAEARLDERWDTVVRAETEDGLRRTGGHVGTPIITFASGQSFFGPVINHVPRGPEALELWDTVERLANFPGFSELKRAIRDKPVIER